MSQVRERAVRPAGAPMVPMAPMHPAPVGGGGTTGSNGAGAQALQQAKEAGGEIRHEARLRAEHEFGRRSSQAAERVSSTAADVRDIAYELRNKGKDGSARLAEQAADRIERMGSYLRDADLDRVSGDLGRLGRERPGALLLGAAALGLVAGRVLKASAGTGAREGAGMAGAGTRR